MSNIHYGTTNVRAVIRSELHPDQLKKLKIYQTDAYSQQSPVISKYNSKEVNFSPYSDTEKNHDKLNPKNHEFNAWYSKPDEVNVKYVLLVVVSVGFIYCIWSANDVALQVT